MPGPDKEDKVHRESKVTTATNSVQCQKYALPAVVTRNQGILHQTHHTTSTDAAYLKIFAVLATIVLTSSQSFASTVSRIAGK